MHSLLNLQNSLNNTFYEDTFIEETKDWGGDLDNKANKLEYFEANYGLFVMKNAM